MGKMLLNGVEYVGGRNTGGASVLEDLTDVNVSSVTDGQILKYDSTTSKWVNDDESGGTVTDIQVNGTTVVDDGVAKITSYKEITLAEYEALPASKLSDGILYAIKDGGQAVNGFPPLIYSDQEREIGVWRDGKPLYQKTKVFSNVSKNGSLSFGVENAENVFICDIGKGSNNIPLPYVHGSVSSNNIGGFLTISANDVTWEFRSGGDAPSSLSGFMTIRYTKTTDTPGSGKYTTYGGLTHHYSTNEQVVGTWIDGKPLYERVFDLGSAVTISSNWTKVINDTNIIPIQCIGIYDTNVASYPLTADSDNDGLYLKGDDVSINKFILQYTKTTD